MIEYTPELLQALGEAIAAYGDVLFSCTLGLEPTKRFKYLTSLSDEELKQRMYLLKDFYSKISGQKS